MNEERYEPVIGLEVHAQLLTRTKLFCGCSTRFGAPPNTNVCPVCLGLPGVLPVLNRKAVELALRMACAVDCRINETSFFARKNYFYPDLPKGYQISQYDQPLAVSGKLPVDRDGIETIVEITRIHMEEDAGKLLHEGFPDSAGKSGVDFNRSGVPLIEIVSEPEIRSPGEAVAYAQSLKTILEYTGVSDANMEKGNLRCDVNISVRPRGAATLGTKVEIKNLNSFRSLARALEYEIDRQIDASASGEMVVQETRLFNPVSGQTETMRGKEEAHDYRYFPEPDLPPLRVSREWLEQVRSSLPELPRARKRRLVEQLGIPLYDAGVLTASRELADYFEAAAEAAGNPKTASNWIMSELLRKVKETEEPLSSCPVTPLALGELIRLIDDGTISGKLAKEVFEKMYSSGKSPRSIIVEEGLTQITDRSRLEEVARRVIEENPQQVAQYRAGKSRVFGWLVGQVMKATRGKANPRLAGEALKKNLEP
ncbi:MAG: Asp-tRNA(Asn)/Glu-tRNA(Gln) amidotransferase subunit GatB [Acidobacteriota bacterium]